MRVSHKVAALMAAVAGAWSVGSTAQAAVVASYTFTGADTNSETGSQYSSTTTAPGVTASAIGDPANAVALEISSAATTPANAPFLRVTTADGNTTPSTAFSQNRYFQFSITASLGSDVDLSSLTFNVARGGDGNPRGFLVRSSADNFATTLTATGSPALTTNADATTTGYDITTVRPNYTAVNIPLTAAAFQNIQSLSGSAITFRVYSYAPAVGSSVDYDDITVNGTVTVPEPASAGLVTMGAIGLLSARRRRR